MYAKTILVLKPISNMKYSEVKLLSFVVLPLFIRMAYISKLTSLPVWQFSWQLYVLFLFIATLCFLNTIYGHPITIT